jgi:hypothetical protein
MYYLLVKDFYYYIIIKMFALFYGTWERNPEGGWGDFKESFNTLKEAVQEFLEIFGNNPDFKKYWFHIVDLETCEMVINEYNLNSYNI